MKKFFKWVAILFGLLVVLAVVGAFLGDPKKTGDSSSASSTGAGTEPAEPPLPVAASQLFSDYEANEVAADQKYKGKRLAVSGAVQSIDKDAFDNIVIELRTSNEFMPVHARLDDAHENLAASLKKGVKIKWICQGDGRIVGSPMVSDCAPS